MEEENEHTRGEGEAVPGTGGASIRGGEAATAPIWGEATVARGKETRRRLECAFWEEILPGYAIQGGVAYWARLRFGRAVATGRTRAPTGGEEERRWEGEST